MDIISFVWMILAQPRQGQGVMAKAREFALKLLVERKEDGRFCISSPNLPGLHLAGKDLDKIRSDLAPVIKDLLYFNSDFIADKIKWVPSLEQVMLDIKQALSPREPRAAEEILVISGRAA